MFNKIIIVYVTIRAANGQIVVFKLLRIAIVTHCAQCSYVLQHNMRNTYAAHSQIATPTKQPINQSTNQPITQSPNQPALQQLLHIILCVKSNIFMCIVLCQVNTGHQPTQQHNGCRNCSCKVFDKLKYW